MKYPIIAPSILAADFRHLENEITKINHSSAEWIHFDVMDGNFVPNISFGFPILEAVRSLTDKFIDVHLMIQQPHRYFEEFKKYGADGLSIHIENNLNLKNDIKSIQQLGLKAGLVLNPDTDIDTIIPYLDSLDLILIMSVFPGFGGQKFIEQTYQRVERVRQLIDSSEKNILLQVDGGVSIENSGKLILAGADVLVCGSAVFRAENFSNYIQQLKG